MHFSQYFKYERQVIGLKQKIYVVGIGPGAPEMMTPQARQALEESDVIAGYPVYLKLLGDLVQNKKNNCNTDDKGGGTLPSLF